MNGIDVKDVSSILNYGLGVQQKIADLNKVSAEIMKQRDFAEVFGFFDEILAMASDADVRTTLQMEQRLDEIRRRFLEIRIDLLKEGNLLKELREVNEVYLLEIDGKIQDADAFSKTGFKKTDLEKDAGDALENTLKKRAQELKTTQAVARSFSPQLKLAEDNCFSIAEKIWNVQMNLIPLVSNRISMDTGQKTVNETKTLIRNSVKEMEKLCDGWEDAEDELTLALQPRNKRGRISNNGFTSLFTARNHTK